MTKKIKFKCKICNYIWESKPNNIINNDKICPGCRESKGEKKIRKFLECNNIVYIKEKRFKKCKYIRTLPFDFYLPHYNLCIEYDGALHFEEVDYFGGLEGLEKRKEKDKIKNNFCKKNDINLLRIPYWEFENINKILEKNL